MGWDSGLMRPEVSDQPISPRICSGPPTRVLPCTGIWLPSSGFSSCSDCAANVGPGSPTRASGVRAVPELRDLMSGPALAGEAVARAAQVGGDRRRHGRSYRARCQVNGDRRRQRTCPIPPGRTAGALALDTCSSAARTGEAGASGRRTSGPSLLDVLVEIQEARCQAFGCSSQRLILGRLPRLSASVLLESVRRNFLLTTRMSSDLPAL